MVFMEDDKMTERNLEQICKNKLLGLCKDCIIDFDTSHHPNNFDCLNYDAVGIILIKVQDKKYKLR